MKRVAVVILNWNGRAMLERFLPSVIAHSMGADVVVADNGSTDDSVAFMQQCFPQVRLVTLDKNYGFAEGYNRAMEEVGVRSSEFGGQSSEVGGQSSEVGVQSLEFGGQSSEVGDNNSSLTTHHSPLTTHHSPLITHHSPLTTRHSPLATHHSPLTTHHSPHTTHHSPLTTHHTPLTTHHYDYYVLLNSDVECTPRWIEPVVEMMEREPQVAVAQPKLLMYDRKDTFEYAGGAGGFIDRYGYPFCRGRLFSTLEKDRGQYDDERDIFWATGACMFVRASVWHELGGLDGDFFAHMEEIDFCWRAQLAGYRVRYCPQSAVYHVGGGTLPKSSPFKTELNFRNNLSMLYKNLPARRRGRVLAMRLWLDRVAALKFLLEGHKGEYLAVRKAHRQYRQWKPQLDAKRTKNGTPVEVPQVYQGLLLPEYYLLGHKRFTQLKGLFS